MRATSLPPARLGGTIGAGRNAGPPVPATGGADHGGRERWRSLVPPSSITTGIEHPKQFDAPSKTVRGGTSGRGCSYPRTRTSTRK